MQFERKLKKNIEIIQCVFNTCGYTQCKRYVTVYVKSHVKVILNKNACLLINVDQGLKKKNVCTQCKIIFTI